MNGEFSNFITYLRKMVDPELSIDYSESGLTLSPHHSNSITTLDKVDAVSEFLSDHEDDLSSEEGKKLVFALKERLVKEAKGATPVIRKIDLLFPRPVQKSGMESIAAENIRKKVQSELKPIVTVKLGIIIESDNLLTNTAALTDATHLLMRGTPLLVNRQFLDAHGSSLVRANIPLQCFHQTDGNFTLLIPEPAKSPVELGFDPKKLIPGTLFNRLEHPKTSVTADVLSLLVNESATHIFERFGYIMGHGSPSHGDKEGKIVGLPTSEFNQLQMALHQRNLKFAIVDSCYAGGGNVETIKESPFPTLLLSSLETVTKANEALPSPDKILDEAKLALKSNFAGFSENIEVQRYTAAQPLENTPQIILPTKSMKESKGFDSKLREKYLVLDKKLIPNYLIWNKKSPLAFISPGGTVHHLIKECTAKNQTLREIAEATFKALELPQSNTKKGIFIEKLICKGEWGSETYRNVVLYMSDKDQILMYQKEGLLSKSEFRQIKSGESTEQPIKNGPILMYQYFAETAQGKLTQDEITEMQNLFFPNLSKAPFHKAASLLIKVSKASYGGEERKEYLSQFQTMLPTLQRQDRINCFELAEKLKLVTFANLIEPTLAPPLTQAIWNPNEDKTISLIQQKRASTEFLTESDRNGKSPLYWALRMGQFRVAEAIIRQIPQNSKGVLNDKNGFIEAIRKGNWVIAKNILALTHCRILEGPVGGEAIRQAVESEHYELIPHLLPLISITREDYPKVIRPLIKIKEGKLFDQFLKSNPSFYLEVEQQGYLNSAVAALNPHAIACLIKHRVDPDDKDQQSKTPLMTLASLQPTADPVQIEIFNQLLKAGADINAINKEGKTALHYALKSKNLPLIEVLLKNGATLFQVDKLSGKTPFELALSHPEILKLVLSFGTDFKCTSKKHHPLLLAIERKDLPLANELLEKGATPATFPQSLLGYYLFNSRRLADPDILKWIMHNDSNWEFSSSTKLSPILQAIIHCPVEIVQELVIAEPSILDDRSLLGSAINAFLHSSSTKAVPSHFKHDREEWTKILYGVPEERKQVILYLIDKMGTLSKADAIKYLPQLEKLNDKEIYNRLSQIMK